MEVVIDNLYQHISTPTTNEWVRGGTFLSPDTRSEGFLRGLNFFPENLRGMKIFRKIVRGMKIFLKIVRGMKIIRKIVRGMKFLTLFYFSLSKKGYERDFPFPLKII